MNYGKKKASQKQKKITSKSTMQGKRVGVRLFKAFLLCLPVSHFLADFSFDYSLLWRIVAFAVKAD